MFDNALPGFVVGVTADRRSDEQVLMLQRLGVDVMLAPTVQTRPLLDPSRLRNATEAVIATPPDYLVASTAVGMRTWFAAAESGGLIDDLRLALRGTLIAARGPKAAGSIAGAGFDVWWRAPTEQLEEVGDHLLAEPLARRRVAIQLHGDGHLPLGSRLRDAGAEVIEVPVYRWAAPDDPRPAKRLVEAVCARHVDAVTFTSAPALHNLVDVARKADLDGALIGAFNDGVIAACIGPVCADAARHEGIDEPLVPTSWRLGSLLRLLATAMLDQRRVFYAGSTELVLQGLVVVVNGEVVRLTDRERAVLHLLASVPGGTVTRRTLLETVWGDQRADAHALESTIGRLRAKLGPAGEVIETAVRRGYRFNASDPKMSRGPRSQVT